MAAVYVAAGVMHFATPEFFVRIVPGWLPWPAGLVYASGVCEIVLGLLVLVPATRRMAAWGIVLLLLAVFPANVNQAVHQIGFENPPAWLGQPTPLGLWLRLPFQGVLIAWAWWYTRRDAI
jgi:uncharacterized membrane protein